MDVSSGERGGRRDDTAVRAASEAAAAPEPRGSSPWHERSQREISNRPGTDRTSVTAASAAGFTEAATLSSPAFLISTDIDDWVHAKYNNATAAREFDRLT